LTTVRPWSYHYVVSTVVKKSVSVPEAIWSAAERAADVRHTTVSALVTEALENYLKIQAGLQAADEWERENGPLTDEELAEADAILDAHGVGIRR
jgi:predicted transcriptional regulator